MRILYKQFGALKLTEITEVRCYNNTIFLRAHNDFRYKVEVSKDINPEYIMYSLFKNGHFSFRGMDSVTLYVYENDIGWYKIEEDD